jgi:hypothetical protein
MDVREKKGLEIATTMQIMRESGAWIVPSASNPRTSYRVIFKHKKCTCTCKDFSSFSSGDGWCKHIWAVDYWLEMYPELALDRLPSVNRNTTRFTRKPTPKRNWTEYNERKESERHVFQIVLHDLCQTLPTPTSGLGRPVLAWGDIVFTLLFKVYSRLSWRYFMPELKRACEQGLIPTCPHRNSVAAYMSHPALAPILTDLITATGTSFRQGETEFAVDSTGFGAGVLNWRENKYGRQPERRDWAKAHIMCGIQSHIVTAIEVTDGDDHDSLLLPGLLAQTAKHFEVKVLCADKGYASAANMEAIEAVGAIPFLAFKCNATGGGGGTWERVFRSYQANQEEYDRNCRKRNAAEATFSAIKRNYDDRVRSKDALAIKNEVLCKFLCHNICCVIKQMSEKGIEPKFQKKASA